MLVRRLRSRFLLIIGLLASLFCGAQQAQPSLQQRLGYPADARLLIIHADDVGMSHSIDRATFEALEKGWVTSASVMVPCPWFPEVARFAMAHPDADLGIHLTLNSEWADLRWAPISPRNKVASLLDADGYFPNSDDAIAKDAKTKEVELELRAQIAKAMSAGVPITHLDTHMATLLRTPQLMKVYQKLGHTYDVPTRLARSAIGGYPAVRLSEVRGEDVQIDTVISMDTGTAKQDWTGWYERTLAPLKPGVYELVVHLAYDDEEMRGATRDHPDWGAAWRQQDLETLRSQEFRDFLKDQGFHLVRWKDLRHIPEAGSDRRPQGAQR